MTIGKQIEALCKAKGWTVMEVRDTEVICLERGWPTSSENRILDACYLYNVLGINPDGSEGPDLIGD